MRKKRTLWEVIGRINFKLFYRITQIFSPSLSRRFLYLGLEDRSIYEDCFTDPVLNVPAFGKMLPSPIGIAAGFDTTFKYNDELIQYGFGFEEFGTFTQDAFSDSVKTKLFPKHKSVLVEQPVFGNKGILFAQKALSERRHLPYVAGINLALNVHHMDDKENATLFQEIQQKLELMTKQVAPYCDYIAINLSHPHLPISSLAANVSILEELIRLLKKAIEVSAPITKTKLVIKLPLDLNQTQIDLLADVFVNTHIDGIILGGYLSSVSLSQKLFGKKALGYIAGQPLKDLSNRSVAAFYKATKGQVPIIACGGIFTGDDAFEKITLGATLVQLHSAILFKGPSIGNQIAKRLAFLIKMNGFRNVQEAVGSANKITPESNA